MHYTILCDLYPATLEQPSRGDLVTKRIVIIGGGPAGYEAALAGAKYGADITLVEDQGLGGAAVIHDCVPSKSFIAATDCYGSPPRRRHGFPAP